MAKGLSSKKIIVCHFANAATRLHKRSAPKK